MAKSAREDRASTWRSILSRVAESSPAAAPVRWRCSPLRRPTLCDGSPTCTCGRWPSGPRAKEAIDLQLPVADNIAAIAGSFGRNANDVTTIVLDRPRHHDLIEEIRAAGARIKLIQDGTVTASISAAIRGTNDHLAIGIGGTRQAVLTAAALRCLGGGIQAQLWPTTRTEIDDAHAAGIEDVTLVFNEEDLAPGDVIVVATGVSNGDLLRGVRFLADSAPDALADHVHALQLGAVHRRRAFLLARAARGSAAADLARPCTSRPTSVSGSRVCAMGRTRVRVRTHLCKAKRRVERSRRRILLLHSQHGARRAPFTTPRAERGP